MITQQGERWFTAADAAELFGPGVVTGSTTGRWVWYEEHDPAAAVRVALGVARRSWVDAVAVAPAGAALAQAGLALAFAKHLHKVRRERGLRGAWVMSPLQPPLPRLRLCRIPHLVTAAGPDGAWQDVVLWEVMTEARFTAWLGREPVGLAGLDARLPRLLGLRRAARDGTLPDTQAVRALQELLRTRCLSTRLVLEHPNLFESLITLKEAR
ncbi:hypothetical protein [Streptosporangium sp. NBC_01469]|uniref:hypothetical protein n=1 Tax=Streptosporangium sp. NBC_01469 TaxID=2903898 RepID=UPI002E28525D|nr:hypothetical protein [Streptosporangium sp. NBC_01469]